MPRYKSAWSSGLGGGLTPLSHLFLFVKAECPAIISLWGACPRTPYQQGEGLWCLTYYVSESLSAPSPKHWFASNNLVIRMFLEAFGLLYPRIGEGRACWSLGNVNTSLGNHEIALEYATRHLEISKEVSGSLLDFTRIRVNSLLPLCHFSAMISRTNVANVGSTVFHYLKWWKTEFHASSEDPSVGSH